MALQSDNDDWDNFARQVEDTASGADIDDLIDDLAAAALQTPTAQATDALLKSLSLAKSTLTKKSVALALAVSAEPGMGEVVDALIAQYRDELDNAFLAPATLDAMYVLACRDTLTRSELSSLLQRIDRTDNGFLVARAATISGRLLQRQACPELQNKLREFSDATDESAAAEARFQLACIEMHDVTSANDRSSVLEALRKAATSFMCVELAEESRPDAHAMSRLLELFLAIAEHANESDVDSRVESIRNTFELSPFWAGYESPMFAIFISRLWQTVDALVAALKAVGEARRWLDIRTALLKLSETMELLTRCNLGESFGILSSEVAGLTGHFVSPKIGAVLVRQVGRERVEAAIREAEESGDLLAAETLTSLAALLDLVETDAQLVSPDAKRPLEQVSEVSGLETDAILEGLADAVTSGDVGQWIESLVPGSVSLRIYPSEPYGADPAVHTTVCRVLEQLRNLLAPYDQRCWNRLVQVVLSVVQFAHRIRDELPDYCLCEQDNGKGQSASENDLQHDLFRDFLREFGQHCVYESGPIAGGRSDAGVKFEEAEFPVEAKHEFRHVNRDHIRNHYLIQPSDYASARQRVSFLLILDLRAANAAAHQDNVRKVRRSGNSPELKSLYTLKESFWCESLPVDAEIADAQPSVVVVGLFPGNRPKPSSQTRYSERPKGARSRRNQ